MSDTGPYVDPRAAEVLCDVIRDPKATLLRMKNARAFAPTVAGGRAELLMPSCTQTSAEKELLRVYREETAYLLRLAYHERALMPRKEKERGTILFAPPASGQLIGQAAIEARLMNVQAWQKGELEPSLGLAVSILRDPDVSMLDLANLSGRFAPSASGDSYVVEEHLLAEEAASAVIVCRRALERSMTASWRSNITSKLAVALSMLGDHASALRWQRDDALENEPSELSAMNWALYALRSESSSSARDAIEFLDQNWGSRTPRSRAWVQANLDQCEGTEPPPGRDLSSLARLLLKGAGEVSSDVLHVTIGATLERN